MHRVGVAIFVMRRNAKSDDNVTSATATDYNAQESAAVETEADNADAATMSPQSRS